MASENPQLLTGLSVLRANPLLCVLLIADETSPRPQAPGGESQLRGSLDLPGAAVELSLITGA